MPINHSEILAAQDAIDRAKHIANLLIAAADQLDQHFGNAIATGAGLVVEELKKANALLDLNKGTPKPGND